MSDEAPEWIRTGFIRQRRSLIVVSVALLLFQAIGAELEKLNLLGNEVKLDQSINVALPLWVLWAYFVLRFYVYYQDLGSKGFVDVMQARNRELAYALGERRFHEAFRRKHEGSVGGPPEIAIVRIEATMAPAHHPWTFDVQGLLPIQLDGPNSLVERSYTERIELKPGEPRFGKTRGMWKAIAHTHRGTEYLLPMVVAAIPLAAAVVNWIRQR